MSKSIWFSGVVAASLGLTAAMALPQQPLPVVGDAESTVTPKIVIATIDYWRVVQSHPEFDKQQKLIERDTKILESQKSPDEKAIIQLRDQLSKTDVNSPEHQQIADALDKRISKAFDGIKVDPRKWELMKRETMMYYRIGSEVRDEVRKFAKIHHIGIVLRSDILFDSDPFKRLGDSDPNKSTCYSAPGLDITEQIIAALQKTERPPTPPPGGAIGPRRTGPSR